VLNDLFEQLASTASRLEKEALLQARRDDALLQQTIKLALDPFTQFYIRKIPRYDQIYKTTFGLEWALDELSKLSSREYTGNKAIEHLTYILSSLTEDNAKVIERVIRKDLRCGVSDATANKIWPALIPEYPCMLASGFDQKLVDKITWPACVQLKLDGMRFNAIVRDGKVEFRSRNGKELIIPNRLFEESFVELMKHYGAEYVFDGELLIVDDSGKVVPRQTGNGILSKSIKGTMSEDEAKQVRATLWDAIPLENFVKGRDEETYETRLPKLVNAISHVKNVHTPVGHFIDLVWTKRVDDIHEAKRIFEKFLAKGEEGTILKTLDMIWENKRSKKQIKFKGELECDLICVDWEEGTGKNVGRLGALVLESADRQLRVNVGTGFSDEQRDKITKKNVLGKVVSVKYNSKIQDKNSSNVSLFLPVFVEIREDKDVADTLEIIK
jgi:ATP-dependent DNA ligase